MFALRSLASSDALLRVGRGLRDAVALGAGLNDVAVVRQPVQERRRHLGGDEHAGPFDEVQVGHAAVMELGVFLGMGTDRYPIPLDMLKYDTGVDGYVVPLDKAKLESARAMPTATGWSTTSSTAVAFTTTTACPEQVANVAESCRPPKRRLAGASDTTGQIGRNCRDTWLAEARQFALC